MTSKPPVEIKDLTVSAAYRIDAICCRLEEALKAGTASRLEDYLNEVEEPLRAALFHQMLLLEWEVFSDQGLPIDVSRYEQRFPRFVPLIRETYRVHQPQSRPSSPIVFGDSELISLTRAIDCSRRWKQRGCDIIGRLGRGAAGSVYLAWHHSQAQLVAVKILERGPEDLEGLERFRQEVQILKDLAHPNIVAIFDYGEFEARPFYSMEYCANGSLADYLKQHRLTQSAAAGLMRILADAVHAAHRVQVVHRDIKPSNVLIQRLTAREMEKVQETEHGKDVLRGVPLEPEEFLVPKLADFGLAKSVDTQELTTTGQILGTPRYMAPEQILGETGIDRAKADVYSLGAVLFECLTNQPVFPGETVLGTMQAVIERDPVPPTRLRKEIPRPLETICLKCLQKNPQDRYADAKELAEDLGRFLSGEAILARRVGPLRRCWRSIRRHPSRLALGCVVVLLLLSAMLLRSVFRVGQDLETAHAKLSREAAVWEYADALLESEHQARETTLLRLSRSLKAAADAKAHDLEYTIRRQIGAWQREIHPLTNEFDHAGKIMAIDCSREGNLIVSGGQSCRALIWDAATGELVTGPLWHHDTIFSVAFSPDAKWVITGSADGTAQVWETATGRKGATLRHKDRVLSVAYSPDGLKVLTGSQDGTAQQWDPSTGEPIGLPMQHADVVRCVKYSPDGRWIATGGNEPTAKLWHAADSKRAGTTFRHPGIVFSLAFSPKGDKLATGGGDGAVRLWNLESGLPIGAPFRPYITVKSVDFSLDGNVLLTANNSTRVTLWEISSGKPIGRGIVHANKVAATAYTRNGRIVTGGYDGRVRVWDSFDPLMVEHGQSIRCFAFRPPGERFLCGCLHNVFIEDAKTLSNLPSVLKTSASILAISPDSSTILTGPSEGMMQLIDAKSGERFGRLMAHQGQTTATFSPDSRTLLTGSRDGSACLWDASSGKRIAGPIRFSKVVSALAFAPDNRTAVLGIWDHAEVWDIKSCKRLGPGLGHSGGVVSAAFSPDGRYILTGTSDHKSYLWDVSFWQLIHPSILHGGRVRAVAFHPNGEDYVTGSDDGVVQRWFVSSGDRLGPPLRHPSRINVLAFDPSGTFFLTGCQDGRVRRYSLPAPIEGSPESIRLWIETAIGRSLNHN